MRMSLSELGNTMKMSEQWHKRNRQKKQEGLKMYEIRVRKLKILHMTYMVSGNLEKFQFGYTLRTKQHKI